MNVCHARGTVIGCFFKSSYLCGIELFFYRVVFLLSDLDNQPHHLYYDAIKTTDKVELNTVSANQKTPPQSISLPVYNLHRIIIHHDVFISLLGLWPLYLIYIFVYTFSSY